MNSDRIRHWYPLPYLMLALLLPAGCQTGGSGGSSGKVPQAAIDACLHSADSYQVSPRVPRRIPALLRPTLP